MRRPGTGDDGTDQRSRGLALTGVVAAVVGVVVLGLVAFLALGSLLQAAETVASPCVYYATEDDGADGLYRSCFQDDRLVDKSAVRPES